jgi:hypothetical protein
LFVSTLGCLATFETSGSLPSLFTCHRGTRCR